MYTQVKKYVAGSLKIANVILLESRFKYHIYKTNSFSLKFYFCLRKNEKYQHYIATKKIEYLYKKWHWLARKPLTKEMYHTTHIFGGQILTTRLLFLDTFFSLSNLSGWSVSEVCWEATCTVKKIFLCVLRLLLLLLKILCRAYNVSTLSVKTKRW